MFAIRTGGAPRRGPSPQRSLSALCLITLLAAGGCVLAPDGTKSERAALAESGKPYEPRFEDRALPDLPPSPDWQDVLHRAFLANGSLEAAYFEWKAAVERIDVAAAYPNSDISLGYEYMFSGDRMNAFDRSTFSAGFDSAVSLSLPIKVEQAGKVALDEARAAGEKFRVAKFDLQREVLRTWADYVLQGRTLALRNQDLSLRRAMIDSALAGAAAGMRLREARSADIELRTAESALLDLQSEHNATRAKLNALLAREPGAALAPAPDFGPMRPLPDDDAILLKAAADRFPEVAVIAREVEGRADALELARLRWIPDISPTLVINGSVSQAVGAMITLPTTISAIRGQIREAEANLRASQATLRQRSADRIGEYLALVIEYRNAERQARTFEQAILPAAQRLSDDQMRAYQSGAAGFSEVIEARRTLLGIHELIAMAHAQMEKTVVEIECCLGLDIETLKPDRTSDRTPASTPPAPAETPTPAAKEAHHAH